MQNEAAEEKAKATGLVGRLQEKIEALKEQARHMQRQMPKPKKKLRQPILNDGKQKPKYKMPPLTAISQPEKAKVAQMEVPRSNNNNRTKRNRRNRRRRQQKKRMSNLKKRNCICWEDRNKIQNIFPTANSWAEQIFLQRTLHIQLIWLKRDRTSIVQQICTNGCTGKLHNY